MALFHLHKRRRLHLPHLEDFPSNKRWKRFLDKIIYAVGIAGPILVIPQVYEIWINKEASGVSIISWAGFVFLGIIWLLYAITHKEKPLIITYIGFIIIQTLVVIGAIIYG